MKFILDCGAEIDVDDVRVINVKPDDVIVCKWHGRLNDGLLRQLKDSAMDFFKEYGCKVVAIDNRWDVEVLKKKMDNK